MDLNSVLRNELTIAALVILLGGTLMAFGLMVENSGAGQYTAQILQTIGSTIFGLGGGGLLFWAANKKSVENFDALVRNASAIIPSAQPIDEGIASYSYMYFATLDDEGNRIWRTGKFEWIFVHDAKFMTDSTTFRPRDGARSVRYNYSLIRYPNRIILVSCQGERDHSEPASVAIFDILVQQEYICGYERSFGWTEEHQLAPCILSKSELVPSNKEFIEPAQFDRLDSLWAKRIKGRVLTREPQH